MRTRSQTKAAILAPIRDGCNIESPLTKLQREAEEEDSDESRPPPRKRSKMSSSPALSRIHRTADDGTSETLKQEVTDENVDTIFPSIAEPSSSPGESLEKMSQLRETGIGASTSPQELPVANMGLFGRLPAELRNCIYRLAFVSSDHSTFVGSEHGSGCLGRCVHTSLSITAGGMACTCRQVRKELMPIFCGENVFTFSCEMVRSRCAANWIRTMSTFASMICKVVLRIWVRIRLGNDIFGHILCHVTIECPAGRTDGRFEVIYDDRVPRSTIHLSELTELVERLNQNTDGRKLVSKLEDIVDSDELAELVYRCDKFVA